MSIIRAKNLEKSFVLYKGSFFNRKKYIIEAIKDINFTIKQGESYGIIGLNGSGKSTLIKSILGIIKCKGDIEVFSKDAFANRKDNMYKIGVVFGQRSQLRWDLSPMESFKLTKEIYKISKEDFEKRLDKFIKLLSMEEFIDQPVRTLSLGQKMKAEITNSLLHNPDIIILDEPTIGLDFMTRKIINDFIRKQNEQGKTILYTSHMMEDIEDVCPKAIILKNGKLVFDGYISQISDIIKNYSYKVILSDDFINTSFPYRKSGGFYIFDNISKESRKHFIAELMGKNNLIELSLYENNLEKFLYGKDLENEH